MSEPIEDCREINETEEGLGQFVIAGGDTSVDFDPPEEVFDLMAAAVVSAMEAGRPVPISTRPTLADGLAIPQVGANAFEILKTRVDRFITVSEEEIAISILRIVELEKGVVEGAAATPLAKSMGLGKRTGK